MALDFTGGNSDRVEIAADASINDMSEWTYAMWIYTDNSTTASQSYFAKGGTGGSRISLDRKSGDANDFDIVIDTTGEPVLKSSNGLNKPINKDYFVAATFDGVIGTSDNAKIYGAPFGEMAIESPSYSLDLQGSGTIPSDASDPLIVGNYTDLAISMYGRASHIHVFNKVLSLEEIQSIQYDFRNTPNTVVNMALGVNGTGSQIDISGNGNHGTVTGAAVIDHVPIPFRKTGQILQFPPAAAAGGRIMSSLTNHGGLGGMGGLAGIGGGLAG